MNILSQDRWVTLWRAAAASGDPLRWYQRLTAAYAEPHRRYHNQQHIAECLAELDDARSLTKEPDKVEWALWFHDAIYDPRAEDNDEKSAALVKDCLTGAGLRRDYVEAVCRLVMVTKSHDVGSVMHAGVMVDVDLAILGQPEERFCEYEAQIGEEYGWVPRNIFAQKRAAILDRFSARERIYSTDWFHKKHEERARRNLEMSIRNLKRLFS